MAGACTNIFKHSEVILSWWVKTLSDVVLLFKICLVLSSPKRRANFHFFDNFLKKNDFLRDIYIGSQDIF